MPIFPARYWKKAVMGFFYISILSIPLLGIVYGVLLLLFWGIARVTRGMSGRRALLPVVAAVFLILPLAEELWIAWNFGRLCKKDAGLSVKKTVQVRGFYDDTTHWWRQLGESDFEFVESRDNTYGGLFRVERDGAGLRHFRIDRPTARYHYRLLSSHKPVAYRVKAFEWIVEDTESNSVIAREKAYAREASWFYIGLNRPTMFCPVVGNHGEKLTGGLYRLVLKPSK